MNNVTNASAFYEEKYNETSNESIEAVNIAKKIFGNEYGEHKIYDELIMYSVSGEIVARMYNLDNNGYVIINDLNGDILEYSFDNKPNMNRKKKYVYNGLLEYYEEVDNKLIDFESGGIFDKSDIKDFFDDKSLFLFTTKDDVKEIQNNSKIEGLTNNVSYSAVENGNLTHSLVTWDSNYYCQVDSAAIVLRYLYDYKWSRFLPAGYETNSQVQSYLCSNKYLVNSGMWSIDVVNGGAEWGRQYVGSSLEIIRTKGLNQYLRDRGITNWNAYYQQYSFNTIKSLINRDRPVVHGCSTSFSNATWNNAHAYVIHGYMVGYDGTPYIYVNDTFGHNNISLNASSVYHPTSYDGIWYID